MTSTTSSIAFEETDEAGSIVATYTGNAADGHIARNIVNDSLQAFSSAIAGLLASRAVLQGVGVGDASASPTAAILLSILQDSIGRIATILFAHRLGMSLEPECKRYRYAADIFNDTAMILDCFSPVLPKPLRVAVLCLAGTLRALCGVAAGSSKASLSVHFAKWGNVGELNAKDSSQETVISLMGMLAGSFVVARVTTVPSTWAAMIFLVGVHLWTNYRAVRAVRMRTLNRQRANIVISHFHESGTILSPQSVAAKEQIFERDGVLKWQGRKIGYGVIGENLSTILSDLAIVAKVSQTKKKEKNSSLSEDSVQQQWRDIVRCFQNEDYLLWYSIRQRRFIACLKQGCSATSQLRAWAHGLLLAKAMSNVKHPSAAGPTLILQTIQEVQTKLQESFEQLEKGLSDLTWEVNSASLETRSGYRLKQIDIAKKTS